MLSGHQAEGMTLEKLISNGYSLVETNARTRFYEIDLIVTKNKKLYFVEVKYRHNEKHGSGFEYITPKKLRQMEWAAEMWCSEKDYFGNYGLMAASVGGSNGDKIEIIELE